MMLSLGGAGRQNGSLVERVDAAGGWESVLGRIADLGWSKLDIRHPSTT
jgi:hypothetical protein